VTNGRTADEALGEVLLEATRARGVIGSAHHSSGAKSVIVANKQRIAELPFSKGNIDIDTMKDWKKFEVLLRSA
jgi:hypothetical protein